MESYRPSFTNGLNGRRRKEGSCVFLSLFDWRFPLIQYIPIYGLFFSFSFSFYFFFLQNVNFYIATLCFLDSQQVMKTPHHMPQTAKLVIVQSHSTHMERTGYIKSCPLQAFRTLHFLSPNRNGQRFNKHRHRYRRWSACVRACVLPASTTSAQNRPFEAKVQHQVPLTLTRACCFSSLKPQYSAPPCSLSKTLPSVFEKRRWDVSYTHGPVSVL